MAAAARAALVVGSDGLPQNLQAGDAFRLPTYTVATLPTLGTTDRALAYASNGRALNTTASLATLAFEGAGAGTGVLVAWNGAAWKVAGTNSTVSA